MPRHGWRPRLDAAFASQHRFVANAPHELRTPLTKMRTLIDVTLARPATSPRRLGPVLAKIRAAVDTSEGLAADCPHGIGVASISRSISALPGV